MGPAKKSLCLTYSILQLFYDIFRKKNQPTYFI